MTECEESLSGIGFMFDAHLEKKIHQAKFGEEIVIKVKVVDNTPGHVQSGHYLWPAASACADYIYEHWAEIHADRVLELGSGCGLPALLVGVLSGSEVVCTDHDFGTLTTIEENFALNNISNKGSAHYLAWGDVSACQALCGGGEKKFRLVIGSDLIYSIDVIAHLMTTVATALEPTSGTFILATSFCIGEALDAKLDEVCARLQIERLLVQSMEDNSRGCKIEQFRLRRPTNDVAATQS
eukprot:scaffold409_cov167-Ochromonas_danica.AAC.9